MSSCYCIFFFLLSDANEKAEMNEEMPSDGLLEMKDANLHTSTVGKACITPKKDQSVNERGKNSTNINKNSVMEHMPYQDDEGKKSGSRCKFPKCKYLTHVFCKDCGKYFCFTRKRNCYTAYHTQNL